MDWVRELCDLYEKNANLAGQYEKGRFGEPLILLPVFHSTVASQITVTINEKGEFLRAVTVEDEEKLTVIPVTEKSASRTAGVEAHPLCDNLKYLASVRKMIGKEEIVSAMEKAGLDPAMKKHVGKYSLGMRQRLGIAQAIMEKPDILILDEPTNGLDKKGVEEFRNLILAFKQEGKTIILASHNAEDVRLLCDNVSELDGGRLIEV